MEKEKKKKSFNILLISALAIFTCVLDLATNHSKSGDIIVQKNFITKSSMLKISISNCFSYVIRDFDREHLSAIDKLNMN